MTINRMLEICQELKSDGKGEYVIEADTDFDDVIVLQIDVDDTQKKVLFH